jgi:hypothetical protein
MTTVPCREVFFNISKHKIFTKKECICFCGFESLYIRFYVKIEVFKNIFEGAIPTNISVYMTHRYNAFSVNLHNIIAMCFACNLKCFIVWFTYTIYIYMYIFHKHSIEMNLRFTIFVFYCLRLLFCAKSQMCIQYLTAVKLIFIPFPNDRIPNQEPILRLLNLQCCSRPEHFYIVEK